MKLSHVPVSSKKTKPQVSPQPHVCVPSRLLRIPEAARYLSAANWFVEELCRNKKIPSLILGKRRVIDVRDLDVWIDAQKQAAASDVEVTFAEVPAPGRAA